MTKEEQKAYNRRYYLADRARFLADGGGCEMEALGELLREKSASRERRTGILTLALIQRKKKAIMNRRGA